MFLSRLTVVLTNQQIVCINRCEILYTRFSSFPYQSWMLLVSIFLLSSQSNCALTFQRTKFPNASASLHFISNHILFDESCLFDVYYQFLKFCKSFMKQSVYKCKKLCTLSLLSQACWLEKIPFELNFSIWGKTKWMNQPTWVFLHPLEKKISYIL